MARGEPVRVRGERIARRVQSQGFFVLAEKIVGFQAAVLIVEKRILIECIGQRRRGR